MKTLAKIIFSFSLLAISGFSFAAKDACSYFNEENILINNLDENCMLCSDGTYSTSCGIDREGEEVDYVQYIVEGEEGSLVTDDLKQGLSGASSNSEYTIIDPVILRRAEVIEKAYGFIDKAGYIPKLDNQDRIVDFYQIYGELAKEYNKGVDKKDIESSAVSTDDTVNVESNVLVRLLTTSGVEFYYPRFKNKVKDIVGTNVYDFKTGTEINISKALEDLVSVLRNFDESKLNKMLLVEGHADNVTVNESKSNIPFSLTRANNFKRYLQSEGVEIYSFTKGFGSRMLNSYRTDVDNGSDSDTSATLRKIKIRLLKNK